MPDNLIQNDPDRKLISAQQNPQLAACRRGRWRIGIWLFIRLMR